MRAILILLLLFTSPAHALMLQWGSDTIEPPAWWLYLGVERGGKKIFDSGKRTIPSIEVEVKQPIIWIRLWYLHRNKWLYADFLYQRDTSLLGRAPDGIYLIAR